MERTTERRKGTVRFDFKSSKKKLEAQKNKPEFIYLWFTKGDDRFKFSTGYECSYNDWDVAKQRVKNRSGILNKDEINTHLSELETFVLKEYAAFSKKYDKVPLHLLKKKLKDFGKESPVEKTQENQLSFHQVIEKYIQEREGNLSKVTERSYKQAVKRLKEYEKYTKKKLEFDDIDLNFYFKFNTFLEKQGYALNTIGKHIKSIKTFFNYALNEGYTRNMKFKSKDFKAKKEITTEIYLTEKEIEEMHKKDLSAFPELEHARDIFLIGCYTGQRVSDYNYFTEDDIVVKDGVQYFQIRQKKNRKYSRTVFCPITREIREIMEKRHNGLPPKTMPEPLINEHIKDLGKMLKFKEKIKCEYTKGGEQFTEMVPKYKLIKTHTARRSFCTNKYKAGMNVFDIMLFSGHTTEKEFYKYIRIRDEERASHIVKSGFFNI